MATRQTQKTRVLVVDDSAFMCKVLREIINSDSELEVVGEARNGRDAVALAELLRPDVITMDIHMPHFDGLRATELIMSQHPRPIIIVSSASQDGTPTPVRALELGAIDFVLKPSAAIDLDMETIREELNRKLKLAAKVRVIRTASRPGIHRLAPAAASIAAPTSLQEKARANSRFAIVVIVASTGGPAAISRIVSELPSTLPAAIVLVLHMPAAFTLQFGAQLAQTASLPVKTVRANETIKPATIYLCPGSHHLRISSTGKLLLDAEAQERYRYRPSADLALETAAEYARSLTMGVVLTGMGNDGASGAQAVRTAGGYVVAQDEATSTIFGMPAEAIKTGAVNEVIPLSEICKTIERHVTELCRLVPAGIR